MDEKLKRVFDELSSEGYRTSTELAERLGVSEKTVRVRLKELKGALEQNGAWLISRQRLGYVIRVFDRERYDDFCMSLKRRRQDQIPVTSDERVDFILAYLLCHDGYIRIEDLSDMMYVSKNTLTGDMKRVEACLGEFGVRIRRKPGHGIRAEGTEFNLRLCIANYMVKRGILLWNDSDRMREEQAVIGRCVLDVFEGHGITLPELSLQNLIHHIYTAFKRIQKGCVMPKPDRGRETGRTMEFAGKLAAEILKLLEERLSLSFPEPEAWYLAVHLAGKRAVSGNRAAGENLIISQRIMDLVKEMLDTVFETFHIDLREDLELRLAMAEHLVPLDIRLNYHLELKNPILEEIRGSYGLAFAVASQAVLPIVKRYKRPLAEDEIGYFAVLFALAMEQDRGNGKKKNILLVCASGKSSAELMAFRYRREFGDCLNEIRLCGLGELACMDFEGIDYVLSTIPIKHPVPVPILEVKMFLEDAEILSLRRTFALENSDFLSEYYQEELFFTDLPCGDMEEVVACLCEKTGEVLELPEGFREAVLERERMAGTDFGNLVALPHPYGVVTETTFVCVGILERPILWKTRRVQCVFLISLSDSENPDILRFYQQTTGLAMDRKKIDRLIEGKDFRLLMRLLGETY